MKYGRNAYNSLGSKIRTQRKELGMTQASLSEGIVTRNMLSRIENGDACPSLDTLTQLAERLGVSVGYLLDERDDGSLIKNERLLSLIKNEFSEYNYVLALQYLENLDYFPEEKNIYTARCKYALGLRMIFTDSPVKEAQKYISDALKLSQYLDPKTVNEGRVYRAMLDAFSYNIESGNEEDFIITLVKNAEFSCDLSLLSSALNVLKHNGSDCADIYVKNTIFENVGYRHLLDGLICSLNCEHSKAKASYIMALSAEIPSVIKCYVLTELEKTCAILKDFENAYCYMSMRKTLVEKLTKK